MRPSFHPRLLNTPLNDPGLYVPFVFQNRAFLFDLGDVSSLSPRDLLKTTHAFITHTHMDHFIGFDQLLRLFLGRDKTLHLYGPQGFIKNVQGRLKGYTWNLVDGFENDLILHVTEVSENRLLKTEFSCKSGFSSENRTERRLERNLLTEPSLTVSCVLLDHGIPCLAFSIKERFHINIKAKAVMQMGLEIGPWLKDFKQALYNGQDPESDFRVYDHRGRSSAKSFVLRELADRIALITRGQKVTYIADASPIEDNIEKMIQFAGGSDQLYIEAAFLDQDHGIAEKKHHLTARLAGKIAARAGAKQFTPFHFSPRYADHPHLPVEEAQAAFSRYSEKK